MIYLCSKCACSLFDGKTNVQISPFVFYEIADVKDENLIVFGVNGEMPICVNFYQILNADKPCENVEKLKLNSNTFLFLSMQKLIPCCALNLKCGNKEISLSVSSEIVVAVNGEVVLKKQVESLIEFSHFESMGDVIILYFTGKTNYVVILQNNEAKFADYYHECNIDSEEKYFMVKKFDMLNHGQVARVKNSEVETYLVYLDDQQLKMQNEFVFLVFLDCFICGNFAYCNNLLCEDIKQKEAKNISKFFCEFDNFIPFKDFAFVFKKNTLAGVYKFEVENKKILNIIHLMPFC